MMLRTLSLLLALSASLLMLGCSSAPNKAAKQSGLAPSWVTQLPTMMGMAYGVGSMEIYGNPAEAVKRAAELATADLVSQLKVTIDADFSSSTSYSQGTHQESQMQSSVNQYIRSKIPTAELDEIVTKETWLDDKYAYALVELNRNQAASRLQRDMRDAELELQDYAQRPQQGTRLQQLQTVLPALKLFAQRERVAERLALVSMQRRNEPLPSELRALEQKIYQQIDALQVSLSLENAGAKTLNASLIEGLTQQGLRLSNQATADLRFVVKAELTDKQQGGNFYSFASSQIIIEDGNGRALNSFSSQAKGVSGLENIARQKAAQQLAKVIADELAATLVEKIR